jgi:hypothetical protein
VASQDLTSRIESQRRFILERASALSERVAGMDDEELRWTVRVFSDCLSPEQRAAHLSGYSESWSVEELRRFVSTFIQEYAAMALADLQAKEGTAGTRLADLTNEELQSMSLAEKWHLLAKEPGGLQPYQLRRELARLFMCKSYDLFHDTGLSEAAVEFPAYHQVQQALEAQPAASVAGLVELILGHASTLGDGTPDEVETALTRIREAIGRTLRIAIPVDQLFTGQMDRLPLARAEEPGEIAPAGPAGILAGDVATTFLILTDLMTQKEWEECVLPLQRQYRSIAEIPPNDVRAILPRLRGRTRDRQITDFAERYRSGRMVAERKVSQDIWEMLSFEERLAILERDNRVMDVAQLARHLAKIFFSFQYDMLFDAGFHIDLLRSSHYQRLVNQLIGRMSGGAQRPEGGRPLDELTRTVTKLMLALEIQPSEARATGLQEIRAVIASALGLPDDLTYAASKEGRA